MNRLPQIPGKFTKPTLFVIHIVGLVGFAVVLFTSYLKPSFWTPAAEGPKNAVFVITVFFLLLPVSASGIHSSRRADRILSLLYTVFAILYIFILYSLVVATGGLWLSPFSDFYATILLTVVILAPLDGGNREDKPPSSRWTLLVRPTSLVALFTFGAVLLHVLFDPVRVAPTLQESALTSPHDWEIGHGIFFFLVLASIFVVDMVRDKRRDRQLEALRAQVVCLRERLEATAPDNHASD